MSHFTCFTVGDVDEIMAPYSEQDEKYFEAVEYTEEEINEVLGYFNSPGHEFSTVDFKKNYPNESDQTAANFYAYYEDSILCNDEETLNKYIGKKRRCFLVQDGKIVRSYHFYNPKAKYDYYGIIGENPFCRWQDIGFLMKDGTRAQCGRIGDLDIEGTIQDEIRKSRELYREVIDGCGKLDHTPWKDYLERMDRGEITIDEARQLYNNQPSVKKFEDWCHKENHWLDADDYLCTEDEYVEFETFPIFCANIFGKWLEKGDMGWWGIVTDEKEPKAWKEAIETALHNAQNEHPDVKFYVLDCHI